MFPFLKILFRKRNCIVLISLFLYLLNANEIIASQRRKIISSVEVKVYRKEKKHLETSALLCALALSRYSLEELKKNLVMNFPRPISKSDNLFIVEIMDSMCPEIDSKEIFENN